MTEEREAREFLLRSGFLHAVRDAHEATTRIVFGSLSREAGFKERSFGFTAYDVLETQLDKVFRIGPFAEPETRDGRGEAEAAREEEHVVRDNLNGSPGWRCGPYRVLLKRHDFGAVDAIRWDKLSPTKQAVSRQLFAENPQLTLDLGGFDEQRSAEADEVTTLVLAHSASEEPIEMELFVGRPRFNADAGPSWWWKVALTADNLGPDPRHATVELTVPIWSDESTDVPLRLRTTARTQETA